MKNNGFNGILNGLVLGFLVVLISVAYANVCYAKIVFMDDFESKTLGKMWLINHPQQESSAKKPVWVHEGGVLKQTNPQPGDPTYAIITGLNVPDYFGIQAMVRIDDWKDHARSRAGLGIWQNEKGSYNGYTWLIHERLTTNNMEFLNDHWAWFEQEATFPVKGGKWHWMKLFIDKNFIYGNIWAIGDKEPTDWLSKKPYANFGRRSPTKLVGLNGGAGLNSQGGYSTASFDNVIVFDDINDRDLELASITSPPIETISPKPSIPTSWSFSLFLKKGLNMISLALKPDKPFTAKSFAALLGVTVVIRYDTAQSKFEAYIPTVAESTQTEGFPIEGGQGYIVNVLEDKQVKFTGQGWGEPITQAAPPYIAEALTDVPDGVWAFVVSGLLEPGNHRNSLMTQSANIVVKNLRSGTTMTTTASDQGDFQAIFVDMNRTPVVLVGDMLEAMAIDSNGKRVSGPFRWQVEAGHLQYVYMQTHMRYREIIPEKTRLLANYPNPFNPETWISYELAESAEVRLDIYDVSGKVG